MKKNQLDETQWHEIHTKKLRRREATREARLIRRKRGLDVKSRKVLAVPLNFSLVNNYDETAHFLEEIHKTVLFENQNIVLNFNQCENLTPETCVVLAAEIDRCIRIRPRSITGNYPNNDDVYTTLEALGFFRLLKVRAQRKFETTADSEIIGLVSGKGKKEQLTEGVLELFSQVPKFHENQDLLGSRIFRALTEAMGNVIDHAYPVKATPERFSIGRWWRAGFRLGNTITLVLYDQGVGIPSTLPTTWPEACAALLGGQLGPDDGAIIKLATELNRTSINRQGVGTGFQQGRGKGLPDIKKLIDFVGAGLLHIYSYKGVYNYAPNVREESATHSVPLQGTLIVWVVNAEDYQANDNDHH